MEISGNPRKKLIDLKYSKINQSLGTLLHKNFLEVLNMFCNFLVAALVRSPAGAAIKIGTCSLGTFIYGGQSCQRTMMMNLKNNPQLSCRYSHYI